MSTETEKTTNLPATFMLPVNIIQDLMTISNIISKSTNELVEQWIKEKLAKFQNEDGVIVPKKAIYQLYSNEKERKALLDAGEPLTDECLFIANSGMFGNPYVRIVYKGQLRKVPTHYVTILEK